MLIWGNFQSPKCLVPSQDVVRRNPSRQLWGFICISESKILSVRKYLKKQNHISLQYCPTFSEHATSHAHVLHIPFSSKQARSWSLPAMVLRICLECFVGVLWNARQTGLVLKCLEYAVRSLNVLLHCHLHTLFPLLICHRLCRTGFFFTLSFCMLLQHQLIQHRWVHLAHLLIKLNSSPAFWPGTLPSSSHYSLTGDFFAKTAFGLHFRMQCLLGISRASLYFSLNNIIWWRI